MLQAVRPWDRVALPPDAASRASAGRASYDAARSLASSPSPGRPAAPGGGSRRRASPCPVRDVHAAGSRLTPTQQAAWDRRADRWLIPEAAVDDGRSTRRAVLRPGAPLVVEIGSGNGESVAAMAAARPRTTCWPSRSGGPGSRARSSALEQAGRRRTSGCWRSTRSGAMEHLFAPGAARGAVDVLPRPVAQEAAPQAPAGHAGVRGWSPTRGSRRGRVAARDRLARLRRADRARCSTPSRCSRAAATDGGRSGR